MAAAESPAQLAIYSRRAIRRLREVAVCVALTALAFLQSPGKIVPDSKIDLAVNPAGFLARALHMWDPTGSFGQVQNQVIGYLWPMGPFFALGRVVGLPAWAVQRLWWALLMCVAFMGVVRLANRLSIGTPTSRLVAGVAYALSPRILTELGSISSEAWPMAVAPWVLVPLIGLATGASIRRAVTLSALAVACAGGMNATAVLAILPPAAIWLLTLGPMRRRLTALGAWCVAVLAATAWWLIPLFLQGRYSPPFLDYIETASATTGVTDSITILRGASHWVAWLASPFGPNMPAGWQIARDASIATATIVLAAIGVAGLARRGMPHRRFLISVLVVGLVMVGLGHISDLPYTFAGIQRAFLDGPGTALRNVHKFDVLVRLPLTLGMAHLLGTLGRAGTIRRPGLRHTSAPAALVSAAAVLAIGVIALPALTFNLAPTRGFSRVPGYWQDAAKWLNAHADDGRVLVLPGAHFPNYTWGDTLDEIAQPLLEGDWAVRSVIPLSPANTIRMMDAIESALATGYGSSGLAPYLARAGVKYVVIRNDLDYGLSGTTPTLLTHQALQRSPGFTPVTTFGPDTGANSDGGVFYDHGLGITVPALEILSVDARVSKVSTYAASDVATVVGGPESLLNLAEAGLLPDAPTVLAGDRASLPATVSVGQSVIITDGLRARDVAFGTSRDDLTETLTAEQAAGAHDYLPEWGTQWETVAAYHGIDSVRASSSGAQLGSVGGARPENQPYAAFDGDPATAWRPAPFAPQAGQWIEFTLEHPQPVSTVVVHFELGSSFEPGSRTLPTKLTIDTGPERESVTLFASQATFELHSSLAVRTVRITIDQVAPYIGTGFGISEIEVPGITPSRTLVIPTPPSTAAPATVVMSAAPSTPACFFVDALPRCSAAVARGSEDSITLDRTFILPVASSYQPTVWARPRAGDALNKLLDDELAARNPLGTPTVTVSTSAVDEPAARGGALVDGDPSTAWWPKATDPAPSIRFSWAAPVTISSIQFTLPTGTAASPAGGINLITDSDSRTLFLSGNRVDFNPPLQTQHLTIAAFTADPRTSLNPYYGLYESLPIAFSEISFGSVSQPSMPDRSRQVTLACGSGPTIRVGGITLRTRLQATLGDLIERKEVPAIPCADSGAAVAELTLGDGQSRLVASASDIATTTRIALTPAARTGPTGAAATPSSPTSTDPVVIKWSSTQRRVTIAPHAQDLVLVVRENTNPGWRASIGDTALTPIVLDGWQQGWLVPAGLAGEVVLTYAPEQTYRLALFGGAALLLLVILLAGLRVRRSGAHNLPVRAFRTDGRFIPSVVGGLGMILTAGLLGLAIVMLALALIAYRNLGGNLGRGRLTRAAEWLAAPILLLIGGWLSLYVVYSPGTNGTTQAAGILAVGILWLSASVVVPSRQTWRGTLRPIRRVPRPPAPKPGAAPAGEHPLDDRP